MLPAWCGGWPVPPPILPNQGMGTEKHPRAYPSWTSILERTPPCDLIPARAVGQEGSVRTHFMCTQTREEGDTAQAEVWQPESKVPCLRKPSIERATLGRTLCLG